MKAQKQMPELINFLHRKKILNSKQQLLNQPPKLKLFCYMQVVVM